MLYFYKVKNFRQQQRPKKNTLVIGRVAVLTALQNGQQLDRIYLDNKAIGQDVNDIKRLALQEGVPVNYVPVAKIDGFNISGHGGCVAQIARVQYQNLQDVISFVIEKGEVPLFLILDGITDIRNIGGIARTAYCTGVHAIVIPDKGVGALNEDAILTSAGALEKIALEIEALEQISLVTVEGLHFEDWCVSAVLKVGPSNQIFIDIVIIQVEKNALKKHRKKSIFDVQY